MVCCGGRGWQGGKGDNVSGIWTWICKGMHVFLPKNSFQRVLTKKDIVVIDHSPFSVFVHLEIQML